MGMHNQHPINLVVQIVTLIQIKYYNWLFIAQNQQLSCIIVSYLALIPLKVALKLIMSINFINKILRMFSKIMFKLINKFNKLKINI